MNGFLVLSCQLCAQGITRRTVEVRVADQHQGVSLSWWLARYESLQPCIALKPYTQL